MTASHRTGTKVQRPPASHTVRRRPGRAHAAALQPVGGLARRPPAPPPPAAATSSAPPRRPSPPAACAALCAALFRVAVARGGSRGAGASAARHTKRTLQKGGAAKNATAPPRPAVRTAGAFANYSTKCDRCTANALPCTKKPPPSLLASTALASKNAASTCSKSSLPMR